MFVSSFQQLYILVSTETAKQGSNFSSWYFRNPRNSVKIQQTLPHVSWLILKWVYSSYSEFWCGEADVDEMINCLCSVFTIMFAHKVWGMLYFQKRLFLSFGNDSTTGHQMWTKHQFLHTWQLCEKKQVYATTVCHVLVVAHTLLLLTFLHIFLRLWAAIRVYNSRNSHLMFLIIQQMEKCPATHHSAGTSNQTSYGPSRSVLILLDGL